VLEPSSHFGTFIQILDYGGKKELDEAASIGGDVSLHGHSRLNATLLAADYELGWERLREYPHIRPSLRQLIHRYSRLRGLAGSNLAHPLVTMCGDPHDMSNCEVVLTDAGESVLADQANAVELNGIDDWILGVHLHSGRGSVCPRAIAIIKRQLGLRERLAREGRIEHDHLFFTDTGRPIPDLKYPYTRWQSMLRRLAIRYRKPYHGAAHVGKLGRNPLLAAKEHGHRPTTMLSVCAAWTEGAVEGDIAAIREAMNYADGSGTRKRSMTGLGPAGPRRGRWHRLLNVRKDGRKHVEPNSQGTTSRPEGDLAADLAVASRRGS